MLDDVISWLESGNTETLIMIDLQNNWGQSHAQAADLYGAALAHINKEDSL